MRMSWRSVSNKAKTSELGNVKGTKFTEKKDKNNKVEGIRAVKFVRLGASQAKIKRTIPKQVLKSGGMEK